MTVLHLRWASLAAGSIAAGGFLIGLSDPAYYSPVTALDYTASILNDLGLATAGVALLIWWRVTPIERSGPIVMLAGVGLVVWAVGNVLEEILRIDIGETLYFVGSVGAFGLLILAGIVALATAGRWRWSGLFLLSLAAGIGFDALPIWPLAWLGFAAVLWLGLLEVDPTEPASLQGT